MSAASKGLDFGRALLEKYGWKDGKGLGRNEDGIVHALKPALKFDNAGVGYSGFSEQFTSQWWERAYNKVAKTIVVVQNESNIKVQQENREELFKTKDERPFCMYNATDYNSFVKTDVLTGEGVTHLVRPAINTESSPKEAKSRLTDEEIFQACGGRTVHKGARHGLSLNGKLARIQRQEQELVLKYHSIQSKSCGSDFVEVEENKNLRKKQKRKSILEGTTDGMRSQCVQPSEEEKKKDCPDKLDDSLKPISKKMKRKESTETNYTKTISAVDGAVNHSCSSETNTEAKNKISKKKKKKKKHEEIEETVSSEVMDILVSEPHKKKKKKKNKENEDTAEDSTITNSSLSEPQKKQKKKKKQENEETSDLEITESLVPEHQKKRRKKKKKESKHLKC